jgi:hypothetical protein
MKKGKSRKVISANIREFHKGQTYARTKRDHDKETADKQAVAVALATARETAPARPKHKTIVG